jgi:hypothetical protein
MNTENREWWLPLFKGVISKDRHSKECDEFAGLCMDYYDGGNSAMFRFATGHAVRMASLAREIKEACAEEDLVKAADLPKMQAFLNWVNHRIDLARAAKAMEAAKASLDAALRNVGLLDDAYARETLMQRCLIEAPHIRGDHNPDEWKEYASV